MSDDLQFDVTSTDDAEHQLRAADDRNESSPFEAVAQKWKTIDEDEALLLSGLTKDEVHRLRRLLYGRFQKINVLVRSSQQDDGSYKALVRARDGREYLWSNDSS